ncbi:MAG: DegV family protein [Solobacterium sp.]|nr:DegV family protein [Solobacterium sp.]
MRTAIVTDTNSSMSPAEGKQRGIFVIPMPVIINGESFPEYSGISFSQVFAAMDSGKEVTTSMPSAGSVLSIWKTAVSQGYDEIVYIPMTSGLSSSYDAACMLAAGFKGKVTVVNNHRISLTLYESVLDARYLADQGMPAEMIRERLEGSDDPSIYITVDSVEYLKKSGRITAAGAAAAALLKIKPVLCIGHDRLDAYAKARGMHSALKKMIESIRSDVERYDPDVRNELIVGMAHTLTDDSLAASYAQKIMDAFPDISFKSLPLPCSVASHTGPGAVGYGLMRIEKGRLSE